MVCKPVDWNLAFVILTFLIGCVAGFQGVYEKFKSDTPKAIVTFHGLSYLITRGAIPSVAFVILYFSDAIDQKYILWAIGCGFVYESVLRSMFYIKKEQAANGPTDLDILRGPFDLLKWYQNYFLESAMRTLTPYYNEQARRKIGFVTSNVPINKNFEDLYKDALEKIEGGYPEPLKTELKENIKMIKIKFDRTKNQVNSQQELDELESRHKIQICYRIFDLVGEEGFLTILE